MISFEVKGGLEEARKIVQGTKLFSLAESLGGVESLIEHPGIMTHASVANSPLAVPDNLDPPQRGHRGRPGFDTRPRDRDGVGR